MRKMTKRSAVVASAVAVAMVGAGAAWAAWTLTGAGTASASAGDVTPLVVTSVSSTALVPGGNADVTFHVANPNKFPVLITGVQFGTITTTTSGCNASSVTAVSAPLPSAPGALALAAQGSTGDAKDIVWTGSLHMDNTSNDACKGATFSFPVTLDAASNAA